MPGDPDPWKGTPNMLESDPVKSKTKGFQDKVEERVKERVKEEAKEMAKEAALSFCASLKAWFWAVIWTFPRINFAYFKCSCSDREFCEMAFDHWNRLWIWVVWWFGIVALIWYFILCLVTGKILKMILLPIAMLFWIVIGFLWSHSWYRHIVLLPGCLENCKWIFFVQWFLLLGFNAYAFVPKTDKSADGFWIFVVVLPIPCIYHLSYFMKLEAWDGLKDLCNKIRTCCRNIDDAKPSKEGSPDARPMLESDKGGMQMTEKKH